MFKKLAFPSIALLVMLALFAPPPASARVRFGITVGPAYPYGYAYPYAPYSNYYVAPAYPYTYGYGSPYYYAPSYAQPYYGYSWGGHRGWDRHEFHERGEHGFHGHDHGHRR